MFAGRGEDLGKEKKRKQKRKDDKQGKSRKTDASWTGNTVKTDRYKRKNK